MFDVIASCCAREYQRVCVCVSPRFAVFLILCQCLCVFKCVLYMSGRLTCVCSPFCMHLCSPALLFVCVCASAVCVCVFPWGFRVSLRGLVFLIRLSVWRHDYRVGLHHGDPGTNWGQSLLSHSCEEGGKENGGRR